MVISHAPATRDALAQEIRTRLDTGAGANATLVYLASTTTVITFNLQDPSFSAPSSGTITANGTPITANATAGGTVDNFELRNKDGTLEIAGTITGVGGGGDIIINNPVVANGQEVELTSLTYSASA